MASPVLVVLGLIHRQHLDISEGVLLGWCLFTKFMLSPQVTSCDSELALSAQTLYLKVAHWVHPSETLLAKMSNVESVLRKAGRLNCPQLSTLLLPVAAGRCKAVTSLSSAPM